MLDINAYKSRLQDMRSELSKRITDIEKDLHHQEEAVEKDFAEQATQSENDEVLTSLDDEAKSTLIRVNSALLRIQNGEYGLCEECGKEINEKRLEVVPYANLCIDCAEKTS